LRVRVDKDRRHQPFSAGRDVPIALQNNPLDLKGRTATPSAARVFGLRMCAVKKSMNLSDVRSPGELLNYDDAALAKAIAAGVLTEVVQ
jgi:hypothetical protein